MSQVDHKYKCTGPVEHLFNEETIRGLLHDRKCSECKANGKSHGLQRLCPQCEEWINVKKFIKHSCTQAAPILSKSSIQTLIQTPSQNSTQTSNQTPVLDHRAQHTHNLLEPSSGMRVPDYIIKKNFGDIVVSLDQIVVGTRSCLFSPYDNKPVNYLGKINDGKRRKEVLNKILTALSMFTQCDNLASELLKTEFFFRAVNQVQKKSYNEGVREGMSMIQKHMENLSDLSVSLMTGSAYSKLAHLLAYTHIDESAVKTGEDLKASVDATKELLRKYWEGTETKVEASIQIQRLFDNEPLQSVVLHRIHFHGGYPQVLKSKKFTTISKEIYTWCKNHSDASINSLADIFTQTGAGNIVKEMYIFRTDTVVKSTIRKRSTKAVFTDKFGHTYKMFKLKNSTEVNSYTKCYVVGRETLEDSPCTITEESGDLYVYWGDQKLDMLTLACDRRYTFVGDIVQQPNMSGNPTVVRHLDARVVNAIKMYRMYERDLWLNSEKSNIVLDTTYWVDGSNMDKCGRTDVCMQLIVNSRYMKTAEKQKQFIRAPMSVSITWEGETTSVVTSLCSLLTQDLINLQRYKWKHPDGYTVQFKAKYFVADNKATNLSIGNQVTGHFRCKHCKITFKNASDITDYCKCVKIASEQPIKFTHILQRAQSDRSSASQGGLIRVSGFFIDYYSERVHVNIPQNHRQLFNSLTPQLLRSRLPLDKLTLVEKALKVYRTNKSMNIIVSNTEIKVTDELTSVTETYSLSSVLDQLESSEDNVTERILQILFYIHYNRNGLTLSDFGMENLEIFSDAPHSIAGIDDRLFKQLGDEVGTDMELAMDRMTEIIGVPRSQMNHSDKRESILRSFEIYFNQKKIETGEVPHEFQNSDVGPDTAQQSQVPDQEPDESQPDQNSAISVSGNPDESSDFAVKTAVGNLMWTLVMMQWLIRQASLSEEKRSENAKREAFIYHWVSFLMFVLLVDRFADDVVTLYLHDITVHMPELFEKIAFAAVNGDMFEECFAEWKVFMRTSCHRKSEAEIACLIKRNKMEHFYLIHPSKKRKKSNSRIKKLLCDMQLCNVWLKPDFLNSKYKEMIDRKLQYLRSDHEYSYLIVEAKNGILLNFTGDISSPVYLPSRPMLCDKQPVVGNNECNHSGCQRKALSKTCNYCCTCCIAQYDCQPNGVPCEAHIASNERRIQRNHDLELDNVQRSTESKSGPKKGRTKQVTSSKASVLSVSRKRKRSDPATPDVADQPDSSPPPKRAKISNNGSSGACTCRSTCKSKTCPCISAGISCSDKCHTGKKGVPTQHAIACVNMDLVMKSSHGRNGSTSTVLLPLQSMVAITYNKQCIGKGTITAYEAEANKPYTVLMTDLAAKSSRMNFEEGKTYSFTVTQLSLTE